MELWIRSQDKKTLTRAEHLDIYDVSIEENVWAIEDCGTDLGEYNTKERALEVLDEIQDNLINYGNVNNLIYEMPIE